MLRFGALKLFDMYQYYAHNCQASTVHKLANGSGHAYLNLITVNFPYTYVALAWFVGVSIKLPVNWEMLPISVTWVGFEVCRALIYSRMVRDQTSSMVAALTKTYRAASRMSILQLTVVVHFFAGISL